MQKMCVRESARAESFTSKGVVGHPKACNCSPCFWIMCRFSQNNSQEPGGMLTAAWNKSLCIYIYIYIYRIRFLWYLARIFVPIKSPQWSWWCVSSRSRRTDEQSSPFRWASPVMVGLWHWVSHIIAKKNNIIFWLWDVMPWAHLTFIASWQIPSLGLRNYIIQRNGISWACVYFCEGDCSWGFDQHPKVSPQKGFIFAGPTTT